MFYLRATIMPEENSLYALYRSWLRNGYPKENQLMYQNCPKSLPRPLPMPLGNFSSCSNEDSQDEASTVENVSAQDLLRMHVKHAKRVRKRLGEERLARIARYRARLALLLCPQADICKR